MKLIVAVSEGSKTIRKGNFEIVLSLRRKGLNRSVFLLVDGSWKFILFISEHKRHTTKNNTLYNNCSEKTSGGLQTQNKRILNHKAEHNDTFKLLFACTVGNRM